VRFTQFPESVNCVEHNSLSRIVRIIYVGYANVHEYSSRILVTDICHDDIGHGWSRIFVTDFRHGFSTPIFDADFRHRFSTRIFDTDFRQISQHDSVVKVAGIDCNGAQASAVVLTARSMVLALSSVLHRVRLS